MPSLSLGSSPRVTRHARAQPKLAAELSWEELDQVPVESLGHLDLRDVADALAEDQARTGDALGENGGSGVLAMACSNYWSSVPASWK